MLEVESGISPDVIAARGYFTATHSSQLRDIGFSVAQAKYVPALVIPVFGVDGSNGLYRIRPDNPPVDQGKRQHDGSRKQKVRKYLQQKFQPLRMDCNPVARHKLGDPNVPLFITEGEKKADAVISRGGCCIASPGVWGFKSRNSAGGVTVTSDFQFVHLKDRDCYIVFDSDLAENPQVGLAGATLFEILERRGASVQIIRLPPGQNGRKQGVDDYLAAGHSLSDLVTLAIDTPKRPGFSIAVTRADGLPGIRTNDRHLRDVVADALEALSQANAVPSLFVHGGALARITINELGKPRIETVGENSLRGQLARAANFYAERERNGVVEFTAVHPPMEVVRDILALGAWTFPTLTSVVETPTLRPDGSIITDPGYDRTTGTFYCPARGLDVGHIPERPTRDELTAALALLREPIAEFPYADGASEANVLALVLTPICRPAIRGNVPMAVINGTQPGTGKGLLTEVVSRITTGRASSMSQMGRGEELRKVITALLHGGDPIIIFDNQSGPIHSPILASAITATEWKDRTLGKTESLSIPQRAVWITTGNAIQLGGDLPRRCYIINMDAKQSQPWNRKNFKHADLNGWVTANRGRLIAAALTLARGWYAAGCPAATVPTLGSFPDWPRVIGGILAFAGMQGFLTNLQTMYAEADEEGAVWEAFLFALAEKYDGAAVKVSDICADMLLDPALQELLPDIGDGFLNGKGEIQPKFPKQLGHALKVRAGRRHGQSEARADRARDDSHAKVARWCFFAGNAGICGISSNATRVEISESSDDVFKNPTGESAHQIPPDPAIPADSGRGCSTHGHTDWRLYPDGNGGFCAVCHPLR